MNAKENGFNYLFLKLSNFWKARIFDPILFLDSNLLISGMGDDNGKWLEQCYLDLHLVQMEKEM